MAEEEVKKELTAEEQRDLDLQKLVKSWNGVVEQLIKLEKDWEKHTELYGELKHLCAYLPPQAQSVLFRIIHRQRFMFFLEDIARESRTGFDKLLIGGNHGN